MTRTKFYRSILVPLIFGVIAAQGDANAAEVKLELSVEPITRVSRSVVLRAVATNQADHPVALLIWDTPLEGLRGRILTVKRNGEPVPYLGVIAKRGRPSTESFLILEPGESSEPVLIDLAQNYDMSESGRYEVWLDGAANLAGRDIASDPANHSTWLSETATEVSAEVVQPTPFNVPAGGQIQKPRISMLERRDMVAVGFKNCTAQQKRDLTALHSLAKSSAAGATSYMKSHSPGSAGSKYKTWFGDSSDSRYARVRDCFSDCETDLGKNDEIYNCHSATDGCKQGDFAYVFAGDSNHDVHICPAFWAELPDEEFGTRYGTIIHEVTHFSNVCKSEDVSDGTTKYYGKAKAKELASEKPDSAVENADNYQYFSE